MLRAIKSWVGSKPAEPAITEAVSASAVELERATGIGVQFGRWLDRRIPPQSRVTLTQRNIFIFPTRTAITFAILLFLLLLGAINYQNSLVYGVAFLLGSLFLVTILHTFRNLSGITLELLESRPGFVGEDIEFTLRLTQPAGRARQGIQAGWPSGVKQWVEMGAQKSGDKSNTNQGDVANVRLFVAAQQRGWFTPGRLLVETRYPLGLLRAWTWVDLNARALIYPKPIFGPMPEAEQEEIEGGEAADLVGSDDFNALRDYQPGDSVRHILWRRYARSDELVLKEYTGYVEPRTRFTLEQASGDVEHRLSQLTGWVITAARCGQEFALSLPGSTLECGAGESHVAAALESLALFGDHSNPANASVGRT